MTTEQPAPSCPEAAAKIDALIDGLEDWRGPTLARVRALIHQAVPGVVETWKWMGSPVWESDGIIAVGNAHQTAVKLTFPHGAALADPDHVFNAGLEGNARRAIDVREGEALDAAAFVALVRAAAVHNAAQVGR